MAEVENDMNFDPSLKKKKKKKTFDLDAALGDGSSAAKPAADFETEQDEKEEQTNEKGKKKEKVTFQPNNAAGDDEMEDIDLENFGMKKKKKKKKEINLDELGDALPDASDTKGDTGEIDDLDLENFGKKKKKKKRAGADTEVNTETADVATDNDKENDDLQARLSGEQDYSYDQLLSRVFQIIRSNNPELATGEKRKFVMRPPQVVKVGTKKTAFVNFNEISKMLHRQPKHLMSFIASELGTVGTCDGSDQLILKGRFTQKHMENVLRRYIKEYVTCHTCRSPDTLLNKETRLFFLQCMSCHSRCSVQTIKTGFQAVTSKRSLNRDK